MEEPKSGVYSLQVIEFITVADQFCKHLVRARQYKKQDFLSAMQRLLPLLYLKAVNLPALEPHFEEGNERFVKEEEYNTIVSAVAALMGQADSFEEPYDQYLHESGEPAAGAISEYLADMYQDVKDCILQYQTGTEEVMNDAIWECSLSFETLWGKKLLSALRAIHRTAYSANDKDPIDTAGGPTGQGEEPDRSSWFISRRQQEYGEE
jgi:hypothetical protein